MNSEIRRILCATNLSGNCDHIYSCAMNLASERDTSLMVMHVISQGSIKAAKTLAYFLNEPQRDVVKEKTYSALQRMKEQIDSFLKKNLKNNPAYAGLVEHMLVYPGEVAEEIVEKANRFGCEAIVLGAHSTSFLTRFFSGGTAKKILDLLSNNGITYIPVIGDNEVQSGYEKEFQDVFGLHFKSLSRILDNWRKAPAPVAGMYLQNFSFDYKGCHFVCCDFNSRRSDDEGGELHDFPGGSWPWLMKRRMLA